MRKKQVWRYYCEYCKKANCSASSISKHEKHCTMNPNRYCRVCDMMSFAQKDISELTMLLPSPADYDGSDGGGYRVFCDEFVAKVEGSMNELRKKTDNCPACIMAAIRQKGIPVKLVKSFEFTAEMEAIFAEYHELEMERERRSWY